MMNNWSFFKSDELLPSGWLRRQLEIQAEGLSGNLDKVWPDIRDSAWIGGDREGWERVPYWLDGFVPMAYLLKDEDKIARAKKYIDFILAHQREDGWICPCSEEEIPTYDTWAVQLISKVLVVYFRFSGDERIPDALYRMMKNYYELLSTQKIRLFKWGKFRWFEGFIALDFLSERYDDEWIAALAQILRSQGYDYAADDAIRRWKRPMNEWTLETHVVNLAMMLKFEAVSHGLLHEAYSGIADRLWDILMRYNGTAAGVFTGDECLSGLSAIQGTELCAVAELMYSFEWLYAQTGDPKWAERLEKIAFNALPAAISDDMWAHQYDQMANQICCRIFPGRSLFRTNKPDSHLFGLEPEFGCCTANFSQAWPKFAASAFLHRNGQILSAVPVPSVLNADGISLELKTEYPFKNEMTYSVKPGKAFELLVRLPSFAENVTVNGVPAEKRDMLVFPVKEGEEAVFTVDFGTSARMVDRPYGMHSVECGSLVFSLPITYEKHMLEYVKDGVERKYPYCDYEYIGTSEWRYGYSSDLLEKELHSVSDCPFSSAQTPVTVKARVRRIPWDFEDGYDTVAAKIPADRRPCSDEQEIDLYPYGCAKLRVTELPFCEAPAERI